MSNILFVCMTNCCVSQLASSYVQFRLKELERLAEFEVHSAGMRVRKGDEVPRATIAALKELGIPPMAYFPRQVALKEVRAADLIVCMSDECAKKLTSSFRSAEGKVVHLMGLVGRKEDVFEPRHEVAPNKNCLMMMKPALDRLVERIV